MLCRTGRASAKAHIWQQGSFVERWRNATRVAVLTMNKLAMYVGLLASASLLVQDGSQPRHVWVKLQGLPTMPPPPHYTPSQDLVNQMVGFMWEPLVAAVKKEPETDLAASMLDTLAGTYTRGGGLWLGRFCNGCFGAVVDVMPHGS